MAEENKIEDISLIIKDLLKVIKVVSMYPADNPLPTSLRRSFAEKLEWIVDEYGELSFEVESEVLSFEDEVIYVSKSSEDNLAGIFYDAGITEFTFVPGLFVDEIYLFLDAVKDYINSTDKSIDLINVIWEKSISHIRFKTLEDIALSDYDQNFDLQDFLSSNQKMEKYSKDISVLGDSEEYQDLFNQPMHDLPDGAAPADSQQEPGEIQGTSTNTGNATFYAVTPESGQSSVLADNEEDEISFRTAEACEAMGLDNLPPVQSVPDTAMILNEEFKLSKEDEKKIEVLLEKDADFDPYESTVELLKEMLHQEPEMSGFYETVTICEKITSEFVSHGKIAEAARIIKYLKQLNSLIKQERPLWSERLKDAVTTAGSKERLKSLSQALNNNPDINPIEIKTFLSILSVGSLRNITDLIGSIEHKHHNDVVIEFLAKNGKKNIDVVGKGIYDKRADVVINAIRVLAQIGDDKSLHYLSKVAEHRDESIRLALVESLKDSPNDKVLPILKRIVIDSSREIGRSAVEAIVSHRGKPAFDTITDIINSDSFVSLDHSDQQSLLVAYSKLGSEEAVSYLVQIARTFNIFRNSSMMFFRMAALEALSVNKSEKCERELLKLSKSLRPSLKKQAQQALRKRREYIYGIDEK